MFTNHFLKLSLSVDLTRLWDYYNTLDKKHQDLKWSWDKHGHDIIDIWQERYKKEPSIGLQTGWAIQSNLVDLDIPCPPYNVTTLPTTDYRNTRLAFGLIEELQTLIPHAYRWGLVIQPPGGTIAKHTDQEDEYTAHIPIQWESDAVFVMGDEPNELEITFPATGEIYVLDTTVPHYTVNRSDCDRIGLIFRFNQQDLPKLLELQGRL